VGTEARTPRVRELVSLRGDADRPAFSPDGRRLAFVGTDVADPPDHVNPSLWVMDLSGAPRNLTADLDRPVGDWAWCDLVMAEDASGPMWLDDGTLAVIVGREGRGIPYRVTLDGGSEPLVDPALPVAAAGLAAASGRLAISAGSSGRAGDVFAVEGGRLRPIPRA
jgi:hypothetical protein